MAPRYHIRYLRRQEIDIERWDACMNTASNRLIYGRSFYLDVMTDGQWDALVLDDYQAVMPLTWRRKFGFTYLYQPYFMPALGVFGNGITEVTVSAFLRAIPSRFKYWDIDLNEVNTTGGLSALPLKETARRNYFLPLNSSYEDLRKGYKRLAVRMSGKAIDNGLEVVRHASPADVIRHYQDEYRRQQPKLTDTIYNRLITVAEMALNEDSAAAYQAQWPDGEIGAFYLLLTDSNFVYSVIGGSTAKGKTVGAFYLLTDAAIRDHAATERTFRFEGSDLPGIAFFDAQFGPSPVPYHHLVMNRLPYPVNLFKR